MAFKMSQVTSRLVRQGLTVHNTWVDAVAVNRKRVYIGIVLKDVPVAEEAAFDVDTAVGKFASVIDIKPHTEKPGYVIVLLMVTLSRLAMIVEHDHLIARMGVDGISAESTQ